MGAKRTVSLLSENCLTLNFQFDETELGIGIKGTVGLIGHQPELQPQQDIQPPDQLLDEGTQGYPY